LWRPLALAWLAGFLVAASVAGFAVTAFSVLPPAPTSQRFFDRYQELNPSPAAWAERMPILNQRELLSTIAHLGGQAPRTLAQIRQTLTPFY